jgi:hypothetical protein
VADNLATPCVRNARSLLVCAVANARLGDESSAKRFERAAEELGIEGYGVVLDIPRMQLALARGDLDAVGRLLETPLPQRGWYRGWMALATIVTRLDGLAAVSDRAKVEAEAAAHLRPNTYLEPFALRALGVVREETALVERALARFEAPELPGTPSRREPQPEARAHSPKRGFQRTSVQVPAGSSSRAAAIASGMLSPPPMADLRSPSSASNVTFRRWALKRSTPAWALRGRWSAMVVMAVLPVSVPTRAWSLLAGRCTAEPARVRACG